MTRLTLAALAAFTGFALLFQGAVDEVYWAVCQTGIALLALVHGVANRHTTSTRLDRWLSLALGAFAVFGVLQLIPLPVPVLEIVAPARAELTKSLQAAGIDATWAPISVEPWASEAALRRWLTAGLALLMVRSMCWSFGSASWWPVVPLLVLAFLEAVVGIAQRAAGVTVQGTLTNRNHFAAVLNTVLPFALAAAVHFMALRLEGKRTPRKMQLAAGIVAIPSVLAMAVASIWSLSRMGFLAMAVASALMGWYALRRYTRRPLVTAAVLAGTVLTGMAAMAPAELVERFAQSGDGDAAAGNRLALWRETLDLVKSSAIFGSGLGAYEPAFLRFKRVAPDRTADYAHNDYLQLLAELGLIGGVIVLVLAVRVVYQLPLNARRGSDTSQWIRAGCLASLTAIGLHSLVDYPAYIPANLLLTAWVAGIALFQTANIKVRRRQAEV